MIGHLRRAWLVALLLVPLVLPACGGSTSQAPTGSSQTSASSAAGGKAASGTPIVIGGTLGLTGPWAGPSAEYKAVYDYWLKQVNDGGGLLGRPVKMTIYNDEGTPTTAQSLFNRLINSDHADLLLSPYTTFIGGAIVPIVLSHNMLLFNGGFVGIDIFDKSNGWVIGSYTYQEPDYSKGIFELIKTLPADQRPTRVGILTNQNPFTIVDRDGHNGQGGVLGYAKENGMQVVFNEQYPSNTTDFSGLIEKAKAANVDLFFELGLPDDSLQVVRAVNQQGFKPKIFCACGSQVTTLPAWYKLGAPAQGVMSTTVSWPSENYSGLSDLAKFFAGRGYKEVPTYGIVAYAILQVLQQAVEGAKTLDQQKLKDYIYSHTFNTVVGNVRYQANGTPAYQEIILQSRGDHNEVLWPSQYATAKPLLPLP